MSVPPDLTPPAIRDPRAFVAAETRLRPVPLVPEISLHVADEAVPLWHRTEEELGEMGLPPPFWPLPGRAGRRWRAMCSIIPTW